MQFCLNSSMSIHKAKDPFFHCIIDNFFVSESFRELLLDWPGKALQWNSAREFIDGKPNLLEKGIRGISKPDQLNGLWKDFYDFTHQSHVFINFIRDVVGDEKIVPDITYNWSGLRENTPGSFQLIHSDALIHPENGREKRFTIMIYFDDKEAIDAGHLELWDDDMKSCKVSIAPIFNRVVVFECTPTSYHGVPECNYNRKAFTMSFVTPSATTEGKRKKAEFVPRPRDSEEVEKQGKARGQVK